MSACYLQTSKLGRSTYRDVVDECDLALSINRDSVKALYRKAVALYHAQRYDHALDALSHASKLADPLRNTLGMSYTACSLDDWNTNL